MAVGMDIDHAFGHDGNFDNVLGWPMTPKSLADIKGYVGATKLPFVIKGVLSVQDAVKCLQAGVQGIVVSHHHGILDSAVPPLMILPEIVKAVGGRMAIFADCGFETGMDVFKGMALGATAVSVGRMVMDELHKDGAAGIVRVVEKVTGELKAAMGHTAMATLDDMEPSVIWEK
jgi:isopentenyl diphosphate isomerase/L-lactate dehydrogenase-like FMN-dependent dehydrogenase